MFLSNWISCHRFLTRFSASFLISELESTVGRLYNKSNKTPRLSQVRRRRYANFHCRCRLIHISFIMKRHQMFSRNNFKRFTISLRKLNWATCGCCANVSLLKIFHTLIVVIKIPTCHSLSIAQADINLSDDVLVPTSSKDFAQYKQIRMIYCDDFWHSFQRSSAWIKSRDSWHTRGRLSRN